MKLPSGKTVYPSTNITDNFCWGEATKDCTRIPPTLKIEKDIINAAINLERIRNIFKKPIIITSWYRDPISNKLAGGVKNSFHLRGYAIDFIVSGIPPLSVYNRLTTNHDGGLGVYPHKKFCHIDWRNWDGYKSGRWTG